MSHKGIRLLIEKTAKSLGDDIQFTYARPSDFNQIRNKRYPFISLGLLTANSSYTVNNVQNYTKVWSCLMSFFEIDKMASIEDEVALILDETDVLVDTFINRLNFYTTSQEGDIIITAINQTPFVKETADILTGQILSFNIQVPDNWNYCENGC
jgi:hypothetical protein